MEHRPETLQLFPGAASKGIISITIPQPSPAITKKIHTLAQIAAELRANKQFALHVIWKWLGNSAPIADKHYLTVTDDHYAQAMEGGATDGTLLAQNAAKPTSAVIRHHPQEMPQALAVEGLGLVVAETGGCCSNV